MIRLLSSFIVCFGISFHASSLHAQDEGSEDVVDAASESVDRARQARPSRMGAGDRRSGRPLRRMDNPTEADIDSFILVASDLKPEWKESLESMRAGDPQKFQQTLRSIGRRIWYLVELKAQNPSLYQLRIEEIQNDETLWALAQAHRESLESTETAASEKILGRLKQLALVQVDLKLRVRAEELAAMASALERLRAEVMMDFEQRQTRADEIVERLLSGKMPPLLQRQKQQQLRQLMEPSAEGAASEEEPPSDRF